MNKELNASEKPKLKKKVRQTKQRSAKSIKSVRSVEEKKEEEKLISQEMPQEKQV